MMVEELAQMILYWNSSYQIIIKVIALVDFRLILHVTINVCAKIVTCLFENVTWKL